MSSRLQAARADRGWSQPQLIAAIVARARQEGAALPGQASLKAMVSRWENGKARPDVLYARLLREVYGLSDHDLGLDTRPRDSPVESATDGLVQLLDAAKATTPEVVLLLQQQTNSFRVLDRSLGAPTLLEQMREHVALLTALLQDGVLGSQRRPNAAVLADAAALAGWQVLDVGSAAQAWQHFETAKAAAREAGDPGLLAHATAEQAYVLIDLHRPGDAADLIAEARRLAGTAAPSPPPRPAGCRRPRGRRTRISVTSCTRCAPSTRPPGCSPRRTRLRPRTWSSTTRTSSGGAATSWPSSVTVKPSSV